MAIYVNGKKVAGNGLGGDAGSIGIPAGGVAGQLLGKKTNADFDTQWVDSPESGGGGTAGVASFNGRTGAVAPKSGDYTASMVGAVPVGAVASIQSLTQAEYDGLAVKDASTLYLIKG